MNQLNAVIKAIHTEGSVSVVVAQAAGIAFHTMVIDNAETADYLQDGKPVTLLFKESAVSIAKNVSGMLSIRNRIPCTIAAIKSGDVLTHVTLDCKGHTFDSLITTYAAKELDLKAGDDVEALIKTTDISLLQPES
jgi:molybdate transport system regulatory protein